MRNTGERLRPFTSDLCRVLPLRQSTRAIIALVDGNILVAEWAWTRTDSLRESAASLEQVNAQLLGVYRFSNR